MTITPLERIAASGVALVAILVLLFLIVPLVVAVPLSFNSEPYFSYPMPGFSLRWYHELFGNDIKGLEWRNAFLNSVFIGISASVLATILGTSASLGIARGDLPFRGALQAMMLSPLVIPVVVYATGVVYFFARISLIGTYSGLIIAHALLGTPYVLITVTASLSGFDRNLTKAGLSLGAPPWMVFRKIALPLIAPGVASGALFAFVTSWDEIIVTLFLAYPDQQTVPRRLWAGVNEQLSPVVIAASTILFVITLGLLVVVEVLRRRNVRLSGTI
ncbi:ABC transporter permease [Rhizobium ruizarguesonis]|uniref:ABC transporter permease n=1 Tax=Rhizobium TaxID=379 RepID=UPI0013C0DD71|nr:ABC transporter permease [Rhizobium ruizarguesonis]MBY5828605.1 ABC transporter permease [Rhizobium leguminosarum]MBY5856342.1 ABC transporter permease [Rhizobium leguminosarum]NEI96517.1 ABC transporter permease subunit [Rhizobium ruizarguesonis]NEJ33860.1 ABC transporter permease subunit [Rhizobium ruizarguesonis]